MPIHARPLSPHLSIYRFTITMTMSIVHRAFLIIVAVAGLVAPARADRIKDLVSIEGVRGNPLVGTGIVTGLAGTGDDASSVMGRQYLAKMLKSLGTTIDPASIKAKNIAVVSITAELPPLPTCPDEFAPQPQSVASGAHAPANTTKATIATAARNRRSATSRLVDVVAALVMGSVPPRARSLEGVKV